jgi:SPX domain protein involved in polyphosphate accumulation
MEIAKFSLTAAGTFLSVLALSFTVFQYWKKKQDKKFEALKKSLEKGIEAEQVIRKDNFDRLARRVEKLEDIVTQGLQMRLSNIEGKLGGFEAILRTIQNWFVNNTPTGGS